MAVGLRVGSFCKHASRTRLRGKEKPMFEPDESEEEEAAEEEEMCTMSSFLTGG